MTTNDNWGFHRGDRNWKTPRQLVGSLVHSASLGGNFILDVKIAETEVSLRGCEPGSKLLEHGCLETEDRYTAAASRHTSPEKRSTAGISATVASGLRGTEISTTMSFGGQGRSSVSEPTVYGSLRLARSLPESPSRLTFGKTASASPECPVDR